MTHADLIAELERETALTAPGTRCAVGTWLATLDASERGLWEDGLTRRDTIYSSVIANKIAKLHGLAIGEQTVARHRRGKCRCSRKS